MRADFVGRDLELALVKRAGDDVARFSGPRVILITGEPGAGKSRLIREAVKAADIPHAMTISGYEPEKNVSLSAVADLLKNLAALAEGRPLVDLLETGNRSDVLDNMRLFETIHLVASTLRPLLITADDLQWADASSLALLHYLVRAAESSSHPLLVLAATRPSPATAGFASSLERSLSEAVALKRLDLRPLDRDAGITMAQRLNPLLTPAEAHQLWETAGGIPFWIEDLAKTPASEASARSAATRLLDLSSDAALLVANLALAGKPLTVEELTRLRRWPLPRVEAAIEEGVSRGALLESMGLTRIAHDLIREAALMEIPVELARSVHAQMASEVGRDAGDDVMQLLRALEHTRAAGEDPVHFLTRVLNSPRRRLVGVEGLRVLVSVIEELPSHKDPSLRNGLAQLAYELGEHSVALEHWRSASEQSSGPTERALALLNASKAAYELGLKDEAHKELSRSRQLDAGHHWLAVAQDAHEALVRLWLNRRPAEAQPFAARAVAGCRALNDDGTDFAREARRNAIQAAFDLASVGARWEEAQELVNDLMEASRGSDVWFLDATFSAAMHLRRSGRWLEASESLRPVWNRARDQVYPLVAMRAGYALAETLYRLGKLDEADEIAASSDELGNRIGGLARDTARFWAGWYGTEISRGKWADAIASLQKLANRESDPHFRAGVRFTVFQALSRLDPKDRADEVMDEIVLTEADVEESGCTRCRLEFLLQASEAALRVGDRERARNFISSYDEQMPPADPVWDLTRERVLALIDVDYETLLRLMERADALGLALESIWIRIDLAELIASSEQKRAIAILEDAAQRANNVGALTERLVAEQALRRLGVRTWKRGRSTGPLLTERETQIAKMVAAGSSNPEIAAAFFLSRKTVERHITNILAKMGARNRTELAARFTSDMRELPDERGVR